MKVSRGERQSKKILVDHQAILLYIIILYQIFLEEIKKISG